MTPQEFKETRIRLKLSYAKLAKALGVHSRTAERYATGERRIPEWVKKLIEELEGYKG